MANAKANSGDSGDFVRYMDMAEELFRRVPHFQATTWLVWVRALLAIDSKDSENGFEIAERGVEIVQHGGFFAHETAATYARAAALYFIAGHTDLAWRNAEKAIEWAKNGPIRLELGIASVVLMQLYAERGSRGDWEIARRYLQAALESFTAVGAELDLGRAHLAGAEILQSNDSSEARFHAERARAIFGRLGRRSCCRAPSAFFRKFDEFMKSGFTVVKGRADKLKHN